MNFKPGLFPDQLYYVSRLLLRFIQFLKTICSIFNSKKRKFKCKKFKTNLHVLFWRMFNCIFYISTIRIYFYINLPEDGSLEPRHAGEHIWWKCSLNICQSLIAFCWNYITISFMSVIWAILSLFVFVQRKLQLHYFLLRTVGAEVVSDVFTQHIYRWRISFSINICFINI